MHAIYFHEKGAKPIPTEITIQFPNTQRKNTFVKKKDAIVVGCFYSNSEDFFLWENISQ